jgi:hypothetical protein
VVFQVLDLFSSQTFKMGIENALMLISIQWIMLQKVHKKKVGRLKFLNTVLKGENHIIPKHTGGKYATGFNDTSGK